MNDTDKAQLAKEKAERLKKIRSLTGLSQSALCENIPLNQSTYISWENGRFGGLTKKGAEKIINFLTTKTDVVCSINWLLEGNGIGPLIVYPEHTNNASDLIEKEIALFIYNNKNSTVVKIQDDTMLPELPKDTYVGGIKKINDPQKFLDKNCIVELTSGQKIVRKIIKGNKPNTFTLIATNLHSDIGSLILQDIELTEVAPIIWIRIKDQ